MDGDEEPRWVRLLGGKDSMTWWFLGAWFAVAPAVVLWQSGAL